MEYPKLRPIDVSPTVHQGQNLIALRDPLGFNDKVLLIPFHLYFLVSLMDGQHSLLDLQAEFMRKFGQLLYTEQILELVEELDKNLFLESERFFTYQEDTVASFKAMSIRPAVLSGKGYPDDPGRLMHKLDGHFLHPEGPGSPEEEDEPLQQKSLKGLIAPHIDFERGGPCFAHAYKELLQACEAETFVLLGTCHQPSQSFFFLTRKDFQTPFGLLPTDKDMVDYLLQACPFDLLQEEHLHRQEHSLELQAVLLHAHLGQKRSISIVPILCGSFHTLMGKGLSPQQEEQVCAFLNILKEAMSRNPRGVCVIASADLSHMGPRFGDLENITEPHLDQIKRDDLEMLKRVESVDAEGFYSFIMQEGDRRRICGLSPIYALLKVLEGKEARLLKYSQWPDPVGTVTFCSVAFY